MYVYIYILTTASWPLSPDPLPVLFILYLCMRRHIRPISDTMFIFFASFSTDAINMTIATDLTC